MFCSQCGTEAVQGARFCSQCGSSLPAEAAPREGQPDTPKTEAPRPVAPPALPKRAAEKREQDESTAPRTTGNSSEVQYDQDPDRYDWTPRPKKETPSGSRGLRMLGAIALAILSLALLVPTTGISLMLLAGAWKIFIDNGRDRDATKLAGRVFMYGIIGIALLFALLIFLAKLRMDALREDIDTYLPGAWETSYEFAEILAQKEGGDSVVELFEEWNLSVKVEGWDMFEPSGEYLAATSFKVNEGGVDGGLVVLVHERGQWSVTRDIVTVTSKREKSRTSAKDIEAYFSPRRIPDNAVRRALIQMLSDLIEAKEETSEFTIDAIDSENLTFAIEGVKIDYVRSDFQGASGG